MPDRQILLKRAVSFNNELAFASGPSTLNLSESQDEIATKTLAIVMVGLPARGKTHISECLKRYLSWLGFSCAVFNVEHRRREVTGGQQSAEFFDHTNEDGYEQRMEFAQACLMDMLRWFENGGHVGIFDATNTTRARRAHARITLESSGARVLFLESVCNNVAIIARNISETRLRSPDYEGWAADEAASDFKRRIGYYEREIQPLDDAEAAGCSYIKVIDGGKQLILHDIQGYLSGKIVGYLLNTHVGARTVYLSRHGESEWNKNGQLGGDPPLTARGRGYARALASYIRDETGLEPLSVWTSQLRRTRETVRPLGLYSVCWRALNEIDAGVCEGLTYAEVEQQFPHVARERKKDKLKYRYPGGESYVDVIHRLEPVILELERARNPILVVAHNAVVRAIYAYFTGMPQEECPLLEIPLHTVFKLTTRAYGVEVETFDLEVDAEYNNRTPSSNSDGN